MTSKLISFGNDDIHTDDNEKEINQPWTEKYRPSKIDDIVDHDDIKRSLKNFIESKSLPHLLLYGPPGSGKTSTIMCCANELYGDYVNCMILRLNASNERGIETVRTTIKQFVNSQSNYFVPDKYRNIFKIVILDEIDAMTIEAQGMLRQTIEKHSDSTRFCLICNDVDKINIALQSRCAMFRFAPLKKKNMQLRLQNISKIESVSIDLSAIQSIVNISRGDMRSAINILQQLSLSGADKITDKSVYKFSGHAMTSVITNIFDELMKLTKSNKKYMLNDIVSRITKIVTNYNLTIYNLLDELKKIVICTKNLSEEKKLYVLDVLAESEKFDAVNIDHKFIIMYISGVFKSTLTM